MVNRFLSSMGITLDNFGAKPLRTQQPQQRMVVDAARIEILASKTRAASIAYKQIPCSTEQGIFWLEQGIL